MLDIGWPELFLIAVVTIVVVGPKELPRVVRTVTGAIRKVRGLAGEFQSTIDDMVRDADLEDIKNEIERVSKVDVADEFKASVDPSGTLDGAFDFDESDFGENSIAAGTQASAKPEEGVGGEAKDSVDSVDPGEGGMVEAGDAAGASGDAAQSEAQADVRPSVADEDPSPADNAGEQRSGT